MSYNDANKGTPRAALVDYAARHIFISHKGEEITDNLITDVVSALYERNGQAKLYGYRPWKNKWLDLSAAGFSRLKKDIASRVEFYKNISKGSNDGNHE